MKTLITFLLVCCGFIIASCSLNRNTASSGSLNAQKMLTGQELITQNDKNKHLATINHQFSSANPEQIQIPDNKYIVSVKRPGLTHKTSSQNRNLISRISQNATSTVSLSNFDKTIKKVVQKPGNQTSYSSRGSASSAGTYLALWLIFLVAAVVVLLLASAFPLALEILYGILLVLTIAGFLVFLSLWLYQKKSIATEYKSGKRFYRANASSNKLLAFLGSALP